MYMKYLASAGCPVNWVSTINHRNANTQEDSAHVYQFLTVVVALLHASSKDRPVIIWSGPGRCSAHRAQGSESMMTPQGKNVKALTPGYWEPSPSSSSRWPGLSFWNQHPSSPYLCHLKVSFSSQMHSLLLTSLALLRPLCRLPRDVGSQSLFPWPLAPQPPPHTIHTHTFILLTFSGFLGSVH